MLVNNDKAGSFTSSEIKEALEGNDPDRKAEAMRRAIMMLLAGEQLPQLFITIVRYVLPSEDHAVQKLLLCYLVSAVLHAGACSYGACGRDRQPLHPAGGDREDGCQGQGAARNGGCNAVQLRADRRPCAQACPLPPLTRKPCLPAPTAHAAPVHGAPCQPGRRACPAVQRRVGAQQLQR